jgi:nucleolar protein 56
MEKVCPNMLVITGSLIGAKLMDQAGGLKNLMEFPASTIQLLGAEKALFRHMKTGAKSPKFGFLHEHPLISQNPKQIQGKIARTLADKICLAVKVDYFKGEFIGDKLLKKIEDKFK